MQPNTSDTMIAPSWELSDSLAVWLAAGWRSDGWQNDLTGFGTDFDKTQSTFFGAFRELHDQALEWLFAGDDMAERIVTTLPEDELRAGYCLRLGDPALEQETQEKLDELGADQKIIEARCWGRLYGKAAIILGADDGRPASMPLVPESAKSLDFLEVVDSRYFYPLSFYQSGPKSGLPELYIIGNPGPNTRPSYVIHESRMVLFGGARTTRTELHRRMFRDHSVLQAPYEVIRSFATGFKSIEVLLTDGPQGVFKINNLPQLLSSKDGLLQERIQLVERMRSVLRAIVIDKDEEFKREPFSFSGIDGVLNVLMLRTAASAKMPVTKLMGMSPAGLNATGENDHRMWNNTVSSSQRTNIAPALRRITEVLLAVSGVKREKGAPIKVEFASLWTLTPKEEAELKQLTAQADLIYIDKGVKTPEEIYLDRFTETGWRPGYSATEEARELREFIVQADTKKVKEGNPPPARELLTPSANEAIVTVNEARALAGLEPDKDPEVGTLKVAEYRAKQETAAEVSGEAEAKEEHGIDPNPQPPPLSGAKSGSAPVPGNPEGEEETDDESGAISGSNPPPGRGDPDLPPGAPANHRKSRT